MSDNTLQFEWIAKLYGCLGYLFRNDPQVFVAGDLLWYPVEGRPDIRTGPDSLVAFGRPKGDRGSYKQWLEGGIAPQVVFEILSPNTLSQEIAGKLQFYETYGVEEYYLYDPDNVILHGWRRAGQRLEPLPVLHDWISPRLNVRFDLSGPKLDIYYPNGERFLTFVEVYRQLKADQQQSERDAEIQKQIEEARRGRIAAEQRIRRMKVQLRAAGIDPDALLGPPPA